VFGVGEVLTPKDQDEVFSEEIVNLASVGHISQMLARKFGPEGTGDWACSPRCRRHRPSSRIPMKVVGIEKLPAIKTSVVTKLQQTATPLKGL
jgi:hypothetical protein